MKRWCRQNSSICREAGLSDEQILDLALQKTSESVEATIMSNKYDLTNYNVITNDPFDDLAPGSDSDDDQKQDD